jgi:hypothetical protein
MPEAKARKSSCSRLTVLQRFVIPSFPPRFCEDNSLGLNGGRQTKSHAKEVRLKKSCPIRTRRNGRFLRSMSSLLPFP